MDEVKMFYDYLDVAHMQKRSYWKGFSLGALLTAMSFLLIGAYCFR